MYSTLRFHLRLCLLFFSYIFFSVSLTLAFYCTEQFLAFSSILLCSSLCNKVSSPLDHICPLLFIKGHSSHSFLEIFILVSPLAMSHSCFICRDSLSFYCRGFRFILGLHFPIHSLGLYIIILVFYPPKMIQRVFPFTFVTCLYIVISSTFLFSKVLSYFIPRE